MEGGRWRVECEVRVSCAVIRGFANEATGGLHQRLIAGKQGRLCTQVAYMAGLFEKAGHSPAD